MSNTWTLKRVATKNRQRLGYRRIVQLLVYLVIVPTVLLLGLGIGIMFIGQRINLVLGILTVRLRRRRGPRSSSSSSSSFVARQISVSCKPTSCRRSVTS